MRNPILQITCHRACETVGADHQMHPPPVLDQGERRLPGGVGSARASMLLATSDPVPWRWSLPRWGKADGSPIRC
jgi:hypothetical protein